MIRRPPARPAAARRSARRPPARPARSTGWQPMSDAAASAWSSAGPDPSLRSTDRLDGEAFRRWARASPGRPGGRRRRRRAASRPAPVRVPRIGDAARRRRGCGPGSGDAPARPAIADAGSARGVAEVALGLSEGVGGGPIEIAGRDGRAGRPAWRRVPPRGRPGPRSVATAVIASATPITTAVTPAITTAHSSHRPASGVAAGAGSSSVVVGGRDLGGRHVPGAGPGCPSDQATRSRDATASALWSNGRDRHGLGPAPAGTQEGARDPLLGSAA